jgi:hypothetical protein
MTNQRKSFIVSVFVILALAFGVMLISQGLMAKIYPRPERVTMDDNGIQLAAPLPDGELDAKQAFKAKVHDAAPVAIEGRTATARPERSKASASAEDGGDTYATATIIPAVPYTDAGTTVGKTYDYNSPAACIGAGGGNGCPDVVYQYTPPVSGTLFVSTCQGGTTTDTRVWVNESVTLTTVGCNDDGCASYASELTCPVTGGLTYYIVIGGWNAAQTGPYVLDVDLFVTGTVCQAPFEISMAAPTLPATATFPVDLSIGLCAGDPVGAVNAVYYNFTAPVAAFYTFSWCDDGVTPLSLLTGIAGPIDCAAFEAYGLNYGFAGCATDGAYSLSLVLTPGQTFLFDILDWCDGLTGTLTVTAEDLPLPNDDCADALDLGVGPVVDQFVHNVNATRDGPGIDLCSPSNPSEVCADVWYVWEADAAGFARISMCDGGTDHKMWVYAGDECLTTNPREAMNGGCSDDGCGVGGGAPFAEVPCVAGDRFLIRVAGWFIEDDPDYGDCSAYGMGVGELDIDVFPTSIRPVNDNCTALVPDLLADRVLLQIPGQSNAWSGWDCLPTLANITFENNVWHAFTLPFCADSMEINFCGTPDGNRYNWNPPFAYAPLFTGCPCSGSYVIISANLRAYQTLRCQAYGFPTTADQNRVWIWRQLIPGDYFFAVYRASFGGPAYFFNYQINFMATEGPCVYCAATANINSCPPVAGATWIDRVTISNLVNPVAPATSGCNAYQNFTALTPAKVYRGFPYSLTVRYGRTGGGALVAGDSCDVWVDWNQNSGLAANQTEVGERVRLTRVGPDVTCTLNVPMDAYGIGEGPSGMTYMRIRMANSADGNNAACGTKTWGEVEDYLLNVVDLECGDFDIDGDIDATDIAFLRAYYFGTGGAPDYWQRGDIDGDGFITIADIIALSDAAYRGGVLNCM